MLAPLDVAVPLGRRAFVDPSLFATERELLFERGWTCVARAEDLAAPGQRVLAPLTPAGIVVIRGVDLELRAFHNVCVHRGMPVVDGPGRADHLSCRYHGWSYDTRGRLARAPDTPACVRARTTGLSPVQVAAWGGFVFVSLWADAPPLADSLRDAPPWLSRAPLASLVRVHARGWITRANWKLVVANFQESHHFPSVHPALERLTPSEHARSWGGDGPWLGGVMPIDPPHATVSTTGEARRRAISDDGVVYDALAFPGMMTSLQPDYLLTYRLWPLAVDETRVSFDILVHPESARPGSDASDLVYFWDRVNDEDREIVERQALGLASPGPDPVAYSTCEDGVRAFERLVARAHAGALR